MTEMNTNYLRNYISVRIKYRTIIPKQHPAEYDDISSRRSFLNNFI